LANAIDPHRRSPLFHRRLIEGEGGAIRMAERPFLGKFILRADPTLVTDLVHRSLGLKLPVEPLTSASLGDTSILWLAPDEWMVVSAPDKGDRHLVAARAELAQVHHQLVDVGDYYTVIELSGPRAREALMKLTTLDLHPRVFRAGMVAGSVFAHANAWVWHTADDAPDTGPILRLIIRWSMADYLWCAVAEAAREWGVPREIPVKGERLTIA
jgi:heterotetrameric sarcosine oxidase gamma subunit